MENNQRFNQDTLFRLETILPQAKLEQMIATCEKVRELGNGYGKVEIIFSKYTVVEFHVDYSVKLRDPDYH